VGIVSRCRLAFRCAVSWRGLLIKERGDIVYIIHDLNFKACIESRVCCSVFNCLLSLCMLVSLTQC